jgi:hypothetical protein
VETSNLKQKFVLKSRCSYIVTISTENHVGVLIKFATNFTSRASAAHNSAEDTQLTLLCINRRNPRPSVRAAADF